jgi:hypothetical protein
MLTDVLWLASRKNLSWGTLTEQLRKTQTRISEPVLVAPEKPSGQWILRSNEIGAETERRHLGTWFLADSDAPAENQHGAENRNYEHRP